MFGKCEDSFIQRVLYPAIYCPLAVFLQKSNMQRPNVAYNTGMRLPRRWCSAIQMFLKCWCAYSLHRIKKSHVPIQMQTVCFRKRYNSGLCQPRGELSQTEEPLALQFARGCSLMSSVFPYKMFLKKKHFLAEIFS